MVTGQGQPLILHFPFGDPIGDDAVQHIQRDGALAEDRVVKGSQVEFVAEFGLSFLAKFQDS